MRSALLLTSFLIAVGGLLAQDPKGKQPVPKTDPKVDPKTPVTPPAASVASDFFPTKKGSKWTYKYAESDVEMEIKESAAEVKIDTLSNKKVVASESLQLKADGIYRTKINNLPIEPPLLILKLAANKEGKLVPMPKGTKWDVDVAVQKSSLKGTYTIGDTTKLKLPAPLGDVDATQVEAKLNIAGTETTVNYWFAPSKGQVKVSYTIAGNTQAMELKSFDEGK